MDAREFYVQITLPNLQEFRGDSVNLRKAYNAAVALFHLHEWFFESPTEMNTIRSKHNSLSNITTITDLRNLIDGEASNDFYLLQDVVNGYKHCFITRTKKCIDRGDRKIEKSPTEWEDDDWWNQDEHIVIMVSDTEKRSFATALRRVNKFYSDHWNLQEQG